MKATSGPFRIPAVSIIVCTKRKECIDNLFSNYARQRIR